MGKVYEMVDRSEELVNAVLEMKRLEDEKKQANREFNDAINAQREKVYDIARKMRSPGPLPLFDDTEKEGEGTGEPGEDYAVLPEEPLRLTGKVQEKEEKPDCFGEMDDPAAELCTTCSFFSTCSEQTLPDERNRGDEDGE